MKNLTALFICFIISNTAFSQINKTKIDEKKQMTVLIGECNRDAFLTEDYPEWFNKEYESYKPDKKTVKQLKKSQRFNELKIKIIFGTWCHDTPCFDQSIP